MLQVCVRVKMCIYAGLEIASDATLSCRHWVLGSFQPTTRPTPAKASALRGTAHAWWNCMHSHRAGCTQHAWPAPLLCPHPQ
jgi:hypothetical protein